MERPIHRRWRHWQSARGWNSDVSGISGRCKRHCSDPLTNACTPYVRVTRGEVRRGSAQVKWTPWPRSGPAVEGRGRPTTCVTLDPQLASVRHACVLLQSIVTRGRIPGTPLVRAGPQHPGNYPGPGPTPPTHARQCSLPVLMINNPNRETLSMRRND